MTFLHAQNTTYDKLAPNISTYVTISISLKITIEYQNLYVIIKIDN
ncbi:MAG: hypothetical protein BWY69_00041 [Planctomycetes bacterium ADurb.Bin401]|nr:MAG: hypothetical protein BWY69_00041 [Planctomycetes bacterium ADurb.Bin401]